MHLKFMTKQSFLLLIVFLACATSSSNLWKSSDSQFCEILALKTDFSDEETSSESNAAPALITDKKEKVTSTSSSTPGGAGIQFMITNRMRRVLEDELNYLSSEVDVMDPQIASVVISRGLSRPRTGMPTKWAKHQPKAPIISKYVVNLKSSFRKFADFVIHKIFPVVLPIMGLVIVIPKIIQLVRGSSDEEIDFRDSLIPARYNLNTRLKPGKSNSIPSSPPRKSAKSPMNRKNVDMKTFNKIGHPTSFLGKLFGQ